MSLSTAKPTGMLLRGSAELSKPRATSRLGKKVFIWP